MINDTKSLKSYSENIERLSHTKDRQYRETQSDNITKKTQTDWQNHTDDRQAYKVDRLSYRQSYRQTISDRRETDRQYHTDDRQTYKVNRLSHRQTDNITQTDRQYHTDGQTILNRRHRQTIMRENRETSFHTEDTVRIWISCTL